MRTLVKNKRVLHYQNIVGTEKEIVNGYFTGNKIKIYSEPIKVYVNVSFPKGKNEQDSVGILSKFDKVAISNLDLGIEEQARIFLDNTPVLNDNGEYDNYDFTCKEVLKSINNYIYGLSKRI